MTKNIEEKTYEEMTISERQNLFREVERDCSVSDREQRLLGLGFLNGLTSGLLSFCQIILR
jgi:hypothetical protein